MAVTVIITTFGDPSWIERGRVAAKSATQQASTHFFHAPECKSLGDARNQAVDWVDPQDWICFLDADDALSPRYVRAMTAALEREVHEHRLYVPALQLNHRPPKIFSDRDILKMNPCPIGTLIHRSTFELAGRFWDEPVYEDWSLFRRAYLKGAGLTWVPDAVYRANSSHSGRNNQVKNPKAMCRQIIASHDEWMAA